MRVSEFQNLMKELYFLRDKNRGVHKTFIWLVEEIGELAENLNKGELDISRISAEMADIIAWTSSLANILDVDLEKALFDKYPNKCLSCNSNPCSCDK